MQTYVIKDGQQYGPFTVEQLRDYVRKGNFADDDLACHDGQNWATVAEVLGQVAATPSQTLGKPKKNLGERIAFGCLALFVIFIWYEQRKCN